MNQTEYEEMLDEAVEKGVLTDEEAREAIDRQTAIEAVSNLASSMSVCLNIDESHGMKRMQEMAVMVLSRLPSAEPERKTGHWIIDGEGMLHCSACAEIPVNRIRDAFKVVYDIHPLKMNYCPNCGVKMVGDSE